jgi:hypothetical protein
MRTFSAAAGGFMAATILFEVATKSAPSGGQPNPADSAARSLVLVVVVAALSIVVVRWVAPVLLASLVAPIQDGIAVVAGLLLFPEFVATTALRRLGRSPWCAVYDVGDVLGWWVRTARGTVRVVLDGLARGAQRVPPGVVAVVSGALVLGHTLA